jgi:hypothetical protein
VFTVVDSTMVDSGEYARVTIYMDYLTDELFPGSGQFGFYEDKYFKILVNGVAATNAEAYMARDKTNAMGGAWFLCANWEDATNRYMEAITLAGTGYFDDFVVTGDGAEPVFGGGAVTITTSIDPSDGHGGTIDPVGPVVLPNGGTTNFDINAAAYWYIASATTNGSSLGIFGASNTNLTLAGVTEDIILSVDFDAVTVSNTPLWWLVQNGGDTNNPTNDSDGDGVPDNLEWPAMTDPNNPSSLFALVVWKADGSNFVQWVSDAIDPDLADVDFIIEKSTNLIQGYIGYSNYPRPTVPTTNLWWEAAMDSVSEFYRLFAPTNSP